MSIADKIISGARNEVERDEFGLPLDASDEVDYLVARILFRYPDIYLDPEDGELYIGTRQLQITQNKLVELADHYNNWCKAGRWPIVVNRLKKVVPRLDRSKLYISEHLLWDIDNHKLIRK